MTRLCKPGVDLNAVDSAGRTLAYTATQAGHSKFLALLADKGADLNKADKNGATPALVAAREGHTESLRVLADRGADLDKADKNGATPEGVAAAKGHVECLRLLTDRGATQGPPPSGAIWKQIATSGTSVLVQLAQQPPGASLHPLRTRATPTPLTCLRACRQCAPKTQCLSALTAPLLLCPFRCQLLSSGKRCSWRVPACGSMPRSAPD